LVTTTGGTASAVGDYTYIPAPTLTSIVPNQGPAGGGNTVVITGTGLASTTAVSFGGTAAGGFTADSATQITVDAPAGSGSAQVTVTTPGGTSNGLPYLHVTAPVVTSILPMSGLDIGGNTVVISGTGFTGATAVMFGSTPATSFTNVTASQLTAVSPAGTGTVQVTVTTPGGTSNGLPSTCLPM
jgi:hypothetical protein